MGQYLIDNNVISAYFSETLSESGMQFMADIIDLIPNISVITEIEALSWINSDKGKEQIVREFVEDANVIPLTSEVVKQCIKIRRSRKIKTPDAIIAATAIVHNFTIITSDADFDNIPNLVVLNPHTI